MNEKNCKKGVTIVQIPDECNGGEFVNTNCVQTPNAISYLDLSAGSNQTQINAALVSSLIYKDQQISDLEVGGTSIQAGENITIEGDGSEENPYIISSTSDIDGFVDLTSNQIIDGEKSFIQPVSGVEATEPEHIATLSQINSSLDLKVDKVSGKGLSTEDYTTSEQVLVGTISGKEDVSNKSIDIETDKLSTNKYSSVKAVYDWGVNEFQSTLISGTNIKTVNGASILGSGDLTITGGSPGIRVYNVKDYGAAGDGITDDTVAIQNTINTVFAAGGGTVYFPIGIYIVGGALQTNISGINYNSQLYVPQTNLDNLSRTTISFLGEVSPNLFQSLGIGTYIAPNSGVILRSTIQGTGIRPSVICNKGANANFVGYSYTNTHFKNLAIQLTPDINSKLTMGGINCEFSAIANFEYITIFPYNLNLVNSGEPDIIDVVGISMPGTNCEHINTLRNCSVGGLTHGYLLGEHTSAMDIVSICCVNGFSQTTNHHIGNYTKLSSFWCKYDFNVLGTFSRFIIQALQTEWINTSKWYDNIATVNDSSNLGFGIINYNIVRASFGLDNTKYKKIGGKNIKSLEISVISKIKDIPSTTTTYIFSGGDSNTDMITTSSSSPVVLYIPDDSVYNFDIGATINIMQKGTGKIQIAATASVVLRSESLYTRKQYSCVSLVKLDTNLWLLTGDLQML